MDGNFVSIRFFFLVFQKFCIIQKGHFWNFINCPFSYIQKVWNGILLAFFWLYLAFFWLYLAFFLFYICSTLCFGVNMIIIITFFAAYISCNLYISIFGVFWGFLGFFCSILCFAVKMSFMFT